MGEARRDGNVNVLDRDVRYLLDDGGYKDGEHDSRRHVFPTRKEEPVRSAANHEFNVVTEPERGRHKEKEI